MKLKKVIEIKDIHLRAGESIETASFIYPLPLYVELGHKIKKHFLGIFKYSK